MDLNSMNSTLGVWQNIRGFKVQVFKKDSAVLQWIVDLTIVLQISFLFWKVCLVSMKIEAKNNLTNCSAVLFFTF